MVYLLPIIVVALYWLAIFALTIWDLTRTKENDEYDELPTFFENCHEVSAKHLYLLGITYGDHNTRYFMPAVTFYIKFYNKYNICVKKLFIQPKLFLKNHRKYARKRTQRKCLTGNWQSCLADESLLFECFPFQS